MMFPIVLAASSVAAAIPAAVAASVGSVSVSVVSVEFFWASAVFVSDSPELSVSVETIASVTAPAIKASGRDPVAPAAMIPAARKAVNMGNGIKSPPLSFVIILTYNDFIINGRVI